MTAIVCPPVRALSVSLGLAFVVCWTGARAIDAHAAQQPATAKLERNKALVRRWMEDGFNRRNLAIVDELFVETFTVNGAPIGRAGLKQNMSRHFAAFPDLRVTITDLIAEGDTVTLWYTVRGTHTGEFDGVPATGKAVSWVGADLLRIESGQIVEGRFLSDSLGLLRQLGAPGNPAPPAPADDYQRLDTLLTLVRNRNARDYAITTPTGIDEGRYVRIGGIDQWITIRGEDRRNPVLLLLHGGPGDATNPWGYAGFRSWLKVFTLVQWDQRGAGRTFGRSGQAIASTITIDRMAQDGVELAELLRTTLGTDKILLLGHSWGSILGVFMAKARPDLFSAFVGTGQVGDPTRNYAVAYDALVEKAQRSGDQGALRELKEIGPPPYTNGRGYAVQRKWSNLFEGADHFIASMFGLALSAPGYTLRDVNDWADGQSLSADRLVPQTNALDATALGGDFKIPIFVIQGAEDFTTPTMLARTFVESIRAPRKEFVALEGGGHFAVFMRPEAFLKELVTRVRP